MQFMCSSDGAEDWPAGRRQTQRFATENLSVPLKQFTKQGDAYKIRDLLAEPPLKATLS